MKTRLDEEIGAPPPASFDVDALLARGRRQVRLRRWVAVGGGAGLSVVALGTAVAVALYGGGTGGAPAGHASSSASSAPTDGSLRGSQLPGPSMTPQTDVEKRLSAVVKAMVQEYAPGAVAAKDGSWREPLAVRNGALPGRGAVFQASAYLSVRGGTGNFYIAIGRQPDFRVDTSCAGMSTSPISECSEATGPRGEVIVTANLSGGRAFIVHVTRTDGTAVSLNTDDGSDYGSRPRSLDEPVFTLDQLVAMGTDPRWTL